MGLNPGTVYWMDTTFFHIDLLQKLYCLFEKTENKGKRGRVGPFKKLAIDYVKKIIECWAVQKPSNS